MSEEFTIEECIDEAQLRATYPVAYQLYELNEETYVRYLQEMATEGYRLIALYEAERCIAISGFRVGRRLYCGKYLHIDNLVVDQHYRKIGAAQQLLHWMEQEAKRLECDVMLADTYTENAPAQALFKREGFFTRGFHLKRDL